MADYAGVDDVAALRPLSEAETARAALLVTYSSVLLRQEIPDLDDRITAGTLDSSLPQLAVVAMTLRALQQLSATPGAKSESTTTGPYAHSVTYAEAVGSGLLTVSDAELAMLLPPATQTTGAGVGSIPLTSGYDRYGAGWASAGSFGQCW